MTRANVVLLLSETGADEVHISSDCQESVLRSTSQTASICLGSQGMQAWGSCICLR